jgi:hypothetical protein
MNLRTFHHNDEVIYVMSLIMFKSMKTFGGFSNGDAEFWFGLEDINGFLQFEGLVDKMADFITLLHKYSFMFNIYCENERLKVML